MELHANKSPMHHVTLRFADAALERAFAEDQARKSLRPIRIALVCAGVEMIRV